MNDVLASLSSTPVSAGVVTSEAVGAAVSSGESEFNRTNPFKAEVLENLNLNGRGSDRETRHIELSLEGSNLDYEPGDSLGVFPENHPRLVDELIASMEWNADERVTVNKSGDQVSVREALLRYFEITAVTKPVVEQLAKLSPGSGLPALLADDSEFRKVMNSCDLLDLVQDYGLKGIPAAAFVAVLRKIPARLYSIASSSKSFPDEVHLTVRTVRYESRGRERYGVCSVHLAERVELGDTLPVFIQQNPNFKLPENPDVPIIMVGPGTGVAPFRSFLGEREETGAEGKTWLFYGDQHFPPISFIRPNGSAGSRTAFLRRWTSLFPVMQKRKYMFSIGCWSTAKNCINGYRKVRLYISVVTRKEWHMMFMLHSQPFLNKRVAYHLNRQRNI